MKKTKRKDDLLLAVFILAIMYLFLHFYIVQNPNNIFYNATPMFDKVEHTVSGFILGFLIIVLFPQRRWDQTVFVTITVLTLLGVGFEIAESFTIYGGNRMDTFTDLCCNTLGACLALAINHRKATLSMK
jgi:VanZ family protein